MMKVAIDTNACYTTQAGIARYVRGLLRGLRAVAHPDLQLEELAWPVENFGYQQPQRALKTLYRELFWMKWRAPQMLYGRQIAVFHNTAGCFIEPPAATQNVVTLHDLAVLRHPERFRPWQRRRGIDRARRLLKAHHVICISRFTADEAMQLLQFPASRLIVIHNGCDFHLSETVPTETKPDVSIPSEFLLFVGSLEPGKNLSLLKQVYALAAGRGRALPPLVIVGARWEGVTSEGTALADWIYLGRQPDAVLVHLYRRALALVFPSKYEGFGLPIAEAMSLRCPVLCSRVASLPEVGGDAALYADLQPADYLDALCRLRQDAALRSQLIERGVRQASEFSWRACATSTAEVYLNSGRT